MQNTILLVKVKSTKKKKVTINTLAIKIVQVYDATNIWLKYN